ncbi:hypothetical protein BD410DRAFT_771211 [Rickenella mellea]|uniref:Uncharacterized protein n=1 Tax=Rickenella mellea TaxID=50990 RepID=A0A4Y7Q3Y7_9AGAM|nr:hypothetical protein BD410DRAFT_771211 [Rickenella mellea]
MSAIENATKLKGEGNTLFGQQKYFEAFEKYSSAITFDQENAILWANRAACNFHLKKYLDASSDAKKATTLDPTYAKAWGRLASASQELGSWQLAVSAWKSALGSLPAQNLSSSELKQKDQYATALANAENVVREREGRVAQTLNYRDGTGAGRDKLPWVRAEKMLPELRLMGREGFNSCAWVIVPAAKELAEGMEMLKDLKTHTGPGGRQMLLGRLGAIERITNAIIREERVFHISDPNFQDLYRKQVMFEAQVRNAWTDAGPESVISEAQERLNTKGWDDVRPALSLTVRAWIFRAFLTSGLDQTHGPAVEFYQNAVDLLERGRKIWSNVPDDQRGAVFSETFVRGVKAQLVDCYMQAYNSKPGKDADFPLERMATLANDLIEDAEKNMPDQNASPGWDRDEINAFYLYPKGTGYAVKGFYHMQMAKYMVDGEEDIHQQIVNAAESYRDAAKSYPHDDEKRYWYYNCALGALWRGHAPLGMTLPVCEVIREGLPKMRRIWEHSQLALGGANMAFKATLEFEEDVRKEIAERRFTEDSCASPDFACDPKK